MKKNDVLTDSEVEKLIDLGRRIKLCLECDVNGTGLPCRTDRLASVHHMVEYLKIHNYKIQ